jgi:hypothetical protein
VSPGTVTSSHLIGRYRRLRSPDLLTWLASLEPLGWVEQAPDGAWRLTDRGLFDVGLISPAVTSGRAGHGVSKGPRPTD